MAPPLASCEHLLLWARNQKCPDPRDKVYGVLGLLDPKIANRIKMDYSTPVWKTYEQLVLAEMEVYQKSNMLNHCSIATRLEGYPSWVPNLALPVEGANVGHLSVRRFYASARSSAVANLVEPDDLLRVTVRRMATISRVSDDLIGSFTQNLKEIRYWTSEKPESDMYVSGGLSMDAYVEVLVRGRTSDRALGDNPLPSIQRLRLLLKSALTSVKLDDEIVRAFKTDFS